MTIAQTFLLTKNVKKIHRNTTTNISTGFRRKQISDNCQASLSFKH